MNELADELENLGDYLSDYHDLALLRQSATERGKKGKDDDSEIETLVALIDQRRSELRLDARFLIERVFAEKPAAFVSRLESYWQTWQAESKLEPTAICASKTCTAAA